MSKPIGVAIIGAGYWGGKFVGEYLTAERAGRVRVVKVCDESVAALGALLINKETSSIGQERLTQNIRDVMEDPEISAVHIATPNSTHYALSKMALEAGKNVLVEKPMTLSSSESYELVGLASAKGLVMQVGHIFRFNKALQVATEMLKRKEIGKVFYIRIQWTDQGLFPDRDIIFDLGPHPVDILNQLLGAWPTRVSGVGRAYRNSRSHNEVAYVFAEFSDDVFAHIELSWLHPRKVREVSILGAEGSLIVNCLNQRLTRHVMDKIDEIPVTPSNTMACEIEHFVNRIAREDTAVDLTGPRTVETLETIRASLWERKIPTVIPLKPEHVPSGDLSTESRTTNPLGLPL